MPAAARSSGSRCRGPAPPGGCARRGARAASSLRWRADAFQSSARGSRPGRYSRSESNSEPSPRWLCTLSPTGTRASSRSAAPPGAPPRTLGRMATRRPSGRRSTTRRRPSGPVPAQPGRAHARRAAPQGHERHRERGRPARRGQRGRQRLGLQRLVEVAQHLDRVGRAPAGIWSCRRTASRSPMNRVSGICRRRAGRRAGARPEQRRPAPRPSTARQRRRPDDPQRRRDQGRQQRQREAGGQGEDQAARRAGSSRRRHLVHDLLQHGRAS